MPLTVLKSPIGVACAFVLAFAACATEPAPTGAPILGVVLDGPVRPVVEPAVGLPGQGVAVVFRNTVAELFVFNPCERATERREGEAWVRLPEELRICNDMAYLLVANGERREIVDVPLYLDPGEYRFVFTMRAQDTPSLSHMPASTSFLVQ